MEIEIKGRDLPLTEALADHAQRRLAFAFSRFGASVRRVVLRLEGLNGPQGGEDMVCRIVLQLSQGGTLITEDRGADAYAVITRAADRCGRRLARLLGREP